MSKFNSASQASVFKLKYLSTIKFNELFDRNGKGVYFNHIDNYIKYNMMFIDENNLIIIPEHKELFLLCNKNYIPKSNFIYGKCNVKRLLKHLDNNFEEDTIFNLISELNLKRKMV